MRSEAPASSLPRGRHSLSREEVTRSQRRRILLAMADTMSHKGYAATSVADVLQAAGVSRKTFYELFSSKEDCFVRAYEEAFRLVLGPTIEQQLDAQSDRLGQFSRGLRMYLDALAAQPALARIFMIEIYAAGPDVSRRRTQLLDLYSDRICDSLGLRGEGDRFAGRAVVAAISMMVTTALIDGDVAKLRALHEPVVGLMERLLATTARRSPSA